MKSWNMTEFVVYPLSQPIPRSFPSNLPVLLEQSEQVCMQSGVNLKYMQTFKLNNN